MEKLITKTRKFVCPKCGRFRMLNKGVELSLCHHCDYMQMVSENQLKKQLKNQGLKTQNKDGV
jgi:hypothetical protein